MSQPPEAYPEESLRQHAQAFPYPPTPKLQISRAQRSVWPRRIGWALALGLLLSFSIPAVRPNWALATRRHNYYRQPTSNYVANANQHSN